MSRPPLSPAAHWFRRAFPAYWLFLATTTHLPKLTLPQIAPPNSDKVIHAASYALLAWLGWQFAATFRPRPSGWLVWQLGALFVGYAALDELTQPLVNRHGDVVDWLCDATGVVVVLAGLEWRRRVRQKLESAAPPQ